MLSLDCILINSWEKERFGKQVLFFFFSSPSIQFSSEGVSSPYNIIFMKWGQSAVVRTVMSSQQTFILIGSLPFINGRCLDL